MKTLLFALLLFITLKLNAQDSTALKAKWQAIELIEKTIKNNRDGKGNNSFSLTYPKLLSIVKTKTTLKNLENQLSGWDSYAYKNSVGYEFNEKTRTHDIPFLKVDYETMLGGKSYVLTAEVLNNLDGNIKKLTVTTYLNSSSVAKFKQTLQANGFLLNENLTKIFRKQAWVKKGQPMFTIASNIDGTISVAIVN